MKIIAVNAGSSSLKFSLFEMDNNKVIASGNFERVGIEKSFYTIKYNGEKYLEEVVLEDHTKCVEILIDRLIKYGIIDSLDEISAVGHRIVNGGEIYTSSVVIDDEVINNLEKLSSLAPLHNPANIKAILAFKKVMPNILMVGVFDTSFHQTISEENFLYATPYEWYEKYKVRKYGFHGTSYRYIVSKMEEVLSKKDLKMIVCHLGSGGSIAAIKDSKSVNTTMGFTPLVGIMMGTRSGDVDSSIIPYVMENAGLNLDEVFNILNKKSGLLGVSNYSSDMRDIIEQKELGNEKCALAFEKYTKTVANYIAQYYVELEGIDALVFTAGIGENSIPVREEVIKKLKILGFEIDKEKNNTRGELVKISSSNSKNLVYVVPTDEELMIAKDTLSFLDRR